MGYEFTTTNAPPVANAGTDKSVIAAANCLGTVVMDGTASFDPDGDGLTYTWTGAFGTATGAMPSVLLPAGVHHVTLTVRDSRGASSSDTVARGWSEL